MTKKILGFSSLLVAAFMLFGVSAAHANAATLNVDSANSASVTQDGSPTDPYSTIQAAVTAASANDTISIIGTQTVTSAINITIPLTITGTSGATIITTGTDYVFAITADGTTISELAFSKTDTASNTSMVWINAANVSITHNSFTGMFNIGDGFVQRALTISGPSLGFNIGNNTFNHLRQPAYIDAATGTIHDNFTSDTKGWVIVSESNITFTNNTWGTNVFDIAIIQNVPVGANNYPDIVAMSDANNNAQIENQFYTPAQLADVYVDGSVPATGNGTSTSPYKTITEAMTRVTSGGTVHVAAGSYIEDVTISTPMILSGASAATTKIMGPKTIGTSATTLTIGASNVTVEGFTITRDGNNTLDWATNAKNQGVTFNQGTSGSTLKNSTVTGNRNGVYMNNTQNNTLTNVIITDNRTGIQFANNVTGTTVTGSQITNNWTLGVLFNNVAPDTTTTSVAINHNVISGNWYGDIASRSANNAPLSLNVTNNYYGVPAPVVSTASSTEPGYATQIPVEFGGTATAPGGMDNILGATSGTLKYDPWCVDAACTPIAPTTTTTVIRFADLANDLISAGSKWFFYNDNTDTLDNTLGSFTTGPTGQPLGLGSALLPAAAGQGPIFATLALANTRLDHITSLSYSTYKTVGDAPLMMSLQFAFDNDLTDANHAYMGRLVYEPYFTNTVTNNVWQTWNPMDNAGSGNWWFSNGALSATCSQGNPCTWAEVLAAFPNSGISNLVAFKDGRWMTSDFSASVDAFSIGVATGPNVNTTTYDFESDAPIVVPPVTPPTTPTTGGGGGGGAIIISNGGSTTPTQPTIPAGTPTPTPITPTQAPAVNGTTGGTPTPTTPGGNPQVATGTAGATTPADTTTTTPEAGIADNIPLGASAEGTGFHMPLWAWILSILALIGLVFGGRYYYKKRKTV